MIEIPISDVCVSKYRAFTRGRILLLVVHKRPLGESHGFDEETLWLNLNQLIENSSLSDDLKELWATAENPSIASFQVSDDKPSFSLVFVDLIDPDRRDPDMFPKHQRLIDDDTLWRFIKAFDQTSDLIQDHDDFSGSAEIILRSISPNWLTSAAQVHVTTGGPGSEPSSDSPQEQYYDWDWIFSTLENDRSQHKVLPYKFGSEELEDIRAEILTMLVDEFYCLQEGNWPSNINEFKFPLDVNIAVLDTAPTEQQLFEALEMVHENGDPDIIAQWILDHKPVGQADAVTIHRPQNVLEALEIIEDHWSICGHDYEMVSHGVFVASIIRMIAPNVRIRLIPVLNDYGIGTIESLVKALEFLSKDLNPAHDPIHIINLSLTLQIDQPDTTYVTVDPRGAILESGIVLQPYQAKDLSFSERQRHPIERICTDIFRNQIIVAAAGNEYKEESGLERPPARFPAALKTVIGVGAAMNQEQDTPELSSFSNMPDTSSEEGFLTLGESLLGIFIDTDFPDQASNMTGWARWSGTSFAAPIIAAAYALLLHQTGQTPVKLIPDLYAHTEPTEYGNYLPVEALF